LSPRIAPASGAERAIGKARNRSNTPVATSWLSIMPVPRVANVTDSTMMPGSEYSRYWCVLPASCPPNT